MKIQVIYVFIAVIAEIDVVYTNYVAQRALSTKEWTGI